MEQKITIPKIEPDDTKQELIERGVELLELKNNAAALEFFNKALEKDPSDVKALVDKGIVLARQGHYKDARALFDKAIEISESKGDVSFKAVANAGIVLSIFGDPNEAIKYFDRVLDNEEKVKQETLLAVLTNKGVTLLQQGKYEESLPYFDRVLEIEPDRIGGLVNKANALQELNRTDEAFPLFIKAHQLTKEPLSWKPTFIIIK
ncbi:MAG TPA: tetratricopeptide repeat protein [Nitrosopumilus sp.]|nr:tetratricopeptide repeat protein [Thermoproteota archaeon]HJJ22849.1 tetratricopeptide repeat protein [Nitrosopumilus sp.]